MAKIDELGMEALLEDSRQNYLGKEVGEVYIVQPYVLDWRRIRDFSWGLSDDNPLYCDPTYARSTRWGCQIAPPTIVPGMRYPGVHGALWDKPYRLNTFISGDKMQWFDVFRVGDAVRTSLRLDKMETKQGSRGPLIFFYSDGRLWNQYDKLVAKQYGTLIMIELPPGKTVGKKMHYEQEAYRYSEKEIEDIVNCYDNEVKQRRGAKPLYWEDVKVGDKLPTMVRGPMGLGDMIMWRRGCFCQSNALVGPFRLQYEVVKQSPATFGRINPATNWPYEHIEWEHEDAILAHYRGLPLPFDMGVMRAEIPAVLITNWMGDDGFLRHFESQFRKPNYYGDTTWYKGEVVKKYKETVGGVEYGAVDIKWEGVSQAGVTTTPGSATVYLPSPDKPVQVPIPYEESRTF